MSCAERAEVEAPPEVEATPFEQAVGAAVLDHDLAELLQAQWTEVAAAEAAAATAAALDESLRRLALSSAGRSTEARAEEHLDEDIPQTRPPCPCSTIIKKITVRRPTQPLCPGRGGARGASVRDYNRRGARRAKMPETQIGQQS